jgi:putative two-component system response regulator
MSPRPHVLVVDDSKTVRMQMQMLLGSRYECHMATSGEEALALLRSGEPPTVVLMDVRMPGIDGVEALRQVKAEPALADVAVVMVTTRGEEETVRRCRELGCDGFVTKPVQAPELYGVLKSVVDARRPR